MTKLIVTAAALVLATSGVPGAASAQDRPSEDELFGAPAEQEPPGRPETPQTTPDRPADGAGDRSGVEQDLFGRPDEPPAAEAAPAPHGRLVERPGREDREDPLAIGGQLYLRASTTWQRDVAAEDWLLSSSNLLDLYADARPNDRVRAFVLGRMFYDPTVADGGAAAGPLGPLELEDAGAALGPLAALGGGSRSNPRAVLDQLWVNFDVGRTAFVTVGKQHVKWGVGKFWNPTDYLHPVKRDPLAVFDERAGTSMVKVHVPWEARGWNAYAVAFLEDLTGRGEPTGRLGRVALGGRLEAVLGTFELGLDAIAQDGAKPRYGVDLSAGVWDLDLYGELALQSGTDGPRWRRTGPGPLDFARDDPDGLVPRLVLGGSYGVKYSDEDSLFLGAEWFWQEQGYEDRADYPFLLAGAPRLVSDPAGGLTAEPQDPGAFTAFYLGTQYAGLFASLPAPGRWNDTSFTLSVLGNLSDRSFVARLDHSLLALTYLRVETYVAGFLGREGGEFRLAIDVPGVVEIPPAVLQAGVALRVAL